MAQKGFTVEDHNKFTAFIAEVQAGLQTSLNQIEETLSVFTNASTCPISLDCDTGRQMADLAKSITESLKEIQKELSVAEAQGQELGIDFKKAYEAFSAQLAENSKKIQDAFAAK